MNCIYDLYTGIHKRIHICLWLLLEINDDSFRVFLCNFWINKLIIIISTLLCVTAHKNVQSNLKLLKCVSYYSDYADNTHRHRYQPLEIWFSDSGDLKTCKSNQNLYFKNLTPKQCFLYHTWVRESKIIISSLCWHIY